LGAAEEKIARTKKTLLRPILRGDTFSLTDARNGFKKKARPYIVFHLLMKIATVK